MFSNGLNFIKAVLLIIILFFVPLTSWAQKTPEFIVSGGTGLLTNSTQYSRNFVSSFSLNLPIGERFLFQPSYSTGSIKGELTDGYFTNSINITHVNFGYVQSLPKLWGFENKLTLKSGLGIMKSEILVYSESNNNFTTYNYPFFTYFVGLDYTLYGKSNFGLNLKLDYYITNTEWLDGVPSGAYDRLFSPGIGVVYKLSSPQPPVIVNNTVPSNADRPQNKLTDEGVRKAYQAAASEMAKAINLRVDSSVAYLASLLQRKLDSLRTKEQQPMVAALASGNNDSTFSVTLPDKSVRKIIVNPPKYKYSIICGGYFTLDKAVAFLNQLDKLGVQSKVIIKSKAGSIFMVSIYEGDGYNDVRSKISYYQSKLEKLKISGKLWIWDKNKAQPISYY